MNPSVRLLRRWERMLPPVDDPAACRPWLGRLDAKGYGFIKVDGTTTRVHRVAWAMEHGDWPPMGTVIRHTCDNPRCCNVRHLTLGTVRDNVADCIARGRRARGESLRQSRLTEEAVREIRRRADAGVLQTEIAASFGVTQACVSSVVTGRTWRHVPQTHRAALDKVAWPVVAA